MKQLLIEVDEALLAGLEKVAPARSRQRSEFIRGAIRRALWDREERAIAEAYAKQPDSEEAVPFDPALWEPAASVAAKPRRAPPAAKPAARPRPRARK